MRLRGSVRLAVRPAERDGEPSNVTCLAPLRSLVEVCRIMFLPAYEPLRPSVIHTESLSGVILTKYRPPAIGQTTQQASTQGPEGFLLRSQIEPVFGCRTRVRDPVGGTRRARYAPKKRPSQQPVEPVRSHSEYHDYKPVSAYENTSVESCFVHSFNCRGESGLGRPVLLAPTTSKRTNSRPAYTQREGEN